LLEEFYRNGVAPLVNERFHISVINSIKFLYKHPKRINYLAFSSVITEIAKLSDAPADRHMKFSDFLSTVEKGNPEF